MRYAKRLGGAPIEYRRADLDATHAQSFELWVTLGGMVLDDALRLSLPRVYAEDTAGHLFEILFPVDGPAQQAGPDLDLETIPDAREMYDALAVMFREWRGRRCSLRFFQDYGPELALSEPVAELLRTRDSAAELVFDVVIEHRYSPLEYAVEKGYGASKTDLLEWLRETLFLFLVWGDQSVDRLPCAAPESLRVAGLIERSDEDTWEISEAGQEHIGALLAEAEAYARDFGIFHDALYDSESGDVQFETARGVDLRMQVWESEGVDPLRAVLLLRLEESLSGSDPLVLEGELGTDGFFEELLLPLVDRDEVDPQHLDAIIDAGLAEMDERQEEAARARVGQ